MNAQLTETEPELCLSVSCGGMGQQWTATGALGTADLVWHKPSWRRLPLTPPQSCQNLHRTGETDSGEQRQDLVCISTLEKGAVTPQETDPDLPMSVQESPVEAWVSGGLLQGWGH